MPDDKPDRRDPDRVRSPYWLRDYESAAQEAGIPRDVYYARVRRLWNDGWWVRTEALILVGGTYTELLLRPDYDAVMDLAGLAAVLAGRGPRN